MTEYHAPAYLSTLSHKGDTPPFDPVRAFQLTEAREFWAQHEPPRPALGDNLCWRWLTIDLGTAGAGVPCLRPKGHSGRCGGTK